MSALGIYQILFYFVVVLALTKPVGVFMARRLRGRADVSPSAAAAARAAVLQAVGRPRRRRAALDGLRRRVSRVPRREVRVRVYAIMRLQGCLPAEPDGIQHRARAVERDADDADLAFNTAASFMTNTNWQSYGGETTMSYFTQMAALAVQNFTSAAAGIADRHRADARLCAAGVEDDRQLLGRSDARTRLRPAADLVRGGAAVRVAGRGAELRSLHAGHDGRGRDADDRAGPGGVAGSDQGAGHQRRRVLQRELGAPVREPHAVRPSSSRSS